MKDKIYGVFSNVNDAKIALGQIKKTCWSKADLSVVFMDELEKGDDQFEFALEGFIGQTPLEPKPDWPGVQEQQIAGVGQLNVGCHQQQNKPGNLFRDELKIVYRELVDGKIVAIVEVEPEIEANVRLILENNGAEIMENQVKT